MCRVVRKWWIVCGLTLDTAAVLAHAPPAPGPERSVSPPSPPGQGRICLPERMLGEGAGHQGASSQSSIWASALDQGWEGQLKKDQ